MLSLASMFIASLWMAPHVAALIVLAALTARLATNFRFLRLARRRAGISPEWFPRVSVLVPARDEAGSITDCVTALLTQDYPDYEVIALDDGSTDETGALLDALAMRDPCLTVHHLTGDPPLDWNGKSFACQQLASHATGDWLLFTDADTVHGPESIARGVRQALGLDVDLLSAFPRQQVRSWSERILVSFIIDFIPLVTINFTALWRGKPTRVSANGQYLLARAETYRAIGGHASIQRAIVDDFALASRFHKCGYSIALVDGGSMLSCRMYHSFREVWSGFAKNLLSALTTASLGWQSLWKAPLFAWLYACLFVLPFANLTASGERALAVIEICWLLTLRGLVVWRLKRPLDEIVTTPLAAWGVLSLVLVALYRRWQRTGILWKGRTYSG